MIFYFWRLRFRLFFLLIISIQFACGPMATRVENTSETLGKIPGLKGAWDSFDNVPPPRSYEALRTQLKASIGHLFSRQEMRGTSGRPLFRRALADFLAESEGVHPDQLHRILTDLVDDNGPGLCAGVSCSQVFGFTKDEVNQELDQVLSEVEKALSQANAQEKSTLKKIRNSLYKFDKEAFFDPIKKVFSGSKKSEGSLAGTCMPTPFLAFGMRGAKGTPGLGEKLKNFRDSVDYRKTGPQIFQGRVGSCHLHALLEIISHGNFAHLSATRKIDRERLFLDIWTESLGGNVDHAIAYELTTLELLTQKSRTEISRTMQKTGVDHRKAFDLFIDRNRTIVRYFGQGGFGEDDLNFIRTRGAVLKGTGLPPLTLEDLEEMGEKLAIARLRVLEQDLLLGKPLSREEKAKVLRPSLEAIFARANEAGAAPRMKVKEELYRYRLQRFPLEAEFAELATNDLVKLLKSTGPVYIESRFHATTLVGYDAKTKTFFVRDTDDPLRRDYVPYSADEFFEYVRFYGVFAKR